MPDPSGIALANYPLPSPSSVDVSPEFYRSRAVRRLTVTAVGMAGIGVWLAALHWIRQESGRDTIPDAELRATGAPEECIAGLLRSGLLSDLGDGTYRLPQRDPYGRSLWRIPPPRQRPLIPDAVRSAVYERDGNACVQCTTTDDLTLDHIYPWSLGGPDTVENLRVLCRSCNSSKGARVL